jgi:hypothetical protein
MTIAIQGAMPIMISPVRYSGSFGRKRTASRHINNGPMTHVINKDRLKSFGLARTAGNNLKSIFTRGGYIIRISPRARGIFVVPFE